VALGTLALAGGIGCRQQAGGMVSMLNVGSRAHENQLIGGFYSPETKTSRWSARVFSVVLKPPPRAGQSGARLWLRFYVPDYQIRAIGPMTLQAEVDGCPVASETVSKGGLHEFSREVPADVLDTNAVPVRFHFDKAAQHAPDLRELGAVIMDVGLRPN
jgi:hypothetical protein